MRLLGPRPFDVLAPGRAARDLLGRFALDPDSLSESDGTEPGLHLIVEDGALRGFWVTMSDNWLADGAGGGRVPPYAKALLDAATEEIWWDRFPVAPFVLGAWRPVIVLEWPPYLADRCGLAPPGMPVEEDEEELEDVIPGISGQPDTTSWLDPSTDAAMHIDEERSLDVANPWGELPNRRSVVCLLRGVMRRTRSVHEGRFELVILAPPEQEGFGVASMPTEWDAGLPMDEWLPRAAAGPQVRPSTHELGFPLRLPGNRVAFPLSGWLSRDLEVFPAQPADAAAGSLVTRDTRNQLLGQMLLSLSVTLILLSGVMVFSGSLFVLSGHGQELVVEPPRITPQPALSVCSADYNRFVDQLRCQVAHLGKGLKPGGECDQPPPELDLQATYCGLRDRQPLSDFAPSFDWAEVAAAQSCFDVLSQPVDYQYRGSLDPSLGSVRLADANKLLADPQLKVKSLEDLVNDLDRACEAYGNKLENNTRGAILAAHVGGGGGEARDLRDLVFERAEEGMSAAAVRCFDQGRDTPLDSAEKLEGICGYVNRDEADFRAIDAWAALGGTEVDAATPSVLARYVSARFLDTRPSDDLWDCHYALSQEGGGGKLLGRWDLKVPKLADYSSAGVRNQLQLDAWLLYLREDGGSSDSCWAEIDRVLAAYVPVHPLMAEVGDDGWPSAEQQLCAQACAVGYRIARNRNKDWVTPGGDLGLCLDGSAIPDNPSRYPVDRLDRLRLPWNYDTKGEWVKASGSEVCSFNLLAQDLFSGVLSDDIAPPLWAGELSSGSRIAGGSSGASWKAAEALNSYGRNRSTATCGYVAAQCLTGELLTVLGDEKLGPHEWQEEWRKRIGRMPTDQKEDVASRPWCQLIRPYIHEAGHLPEGQFEFPCAKGVADTRRRIEIALTRVSSSAFRESTQ